MEEKEKPADRDVGMEAGNGHPTFSLAELIGEGVVGLARWPIEVCFMESSRLRLWGEII